jgi:uncharacterized protein DUF4190/uncharacterized protein DUF4339
MYKVQGTDGRQYGPVSADVLRDWITQGRVNAQTMIQLEGSSDWKPIAQFAEFASALNIPPRTTAAPPVPPSLPPSSPAPLSSPQPAAPSKTSGLAIASLILGILAFPTCGIGGLVGLILGIVALIKISNSGGRLEGKGMAITGIVLSSLFLLIAPALMLPALAKAKARAQRITCISNLKIIGLSARGWADDHNGKFPPDLLMMSNETLIPKVLVCPADPNRSRNSYRDWSAVATGGTSYEYFGSKASPSRPQDVLLRCKIHNNVGLSDGSAQQFSGAMFGEPKR